MQLRRPFFHHISVFPALPIAFFVAACQFPQGQPAEQVAIDLPATFAAASQGENAEIATGWLKTLDSRPLTGVVHNALAQNPSLKAAASRLKGAREGVIIGRAARLPSVSSSTGANYSGFDGDFDESFSLSLNASWEPDLWGRLRDLEAASYGDYVVAVSDFRSARLSLAINTAQTWCNLVTAEKQLILARQTLASFQENFQIIERGYKAGILRPLDVNFGRNNIASAQRNLRSRQLDRNDAARALEVLLGAYPDAETFTNAELPSIPARLHAGIPSDLLNRRPDLSARQAQLFSSAKRADAARKNLLPNLRLSTSNGTSSPQIQDLLDLNILASSISASLSQTLFSGGELSARARQALADNRTQINLYAQDVLVALREVESALDTANALRDQQRFLEQESRQATLAEQLAERELIEGTATNSETQVLELLEAQRRAVSARAALISLRNREVQNHLDLLLALGGSI
jgi:NodT family efflux transporter outer membrane factor (OMF) lipoprotein